MDHIPPLVGADVGWWVAQVGEGHWSLVPAFNADTIHSSTSNSSIIPSNNYFIIRPSLDSMITL